MTRSYLTLGEMLARMDLKRRALDLFWKFRDRLPEPKGRYKSKTYLEVLMPFSRPQNVPFLENNLYRSNVATWRLIQYGEKGDTTWTTWGFNDVVPRPDAKKGWVDPCYHKLNAWIAKHKPMPVYTGGPDDDGIDDEAYYLFMCDDDAINYRMVRAIRRQTAPVVVVSARRGRRTPWKSRHHHSTLVAAPQNMRPGCVTLSQLALRGDVLRKIRFLENDREADGKLASLLRAFFGDEVKYLPGQYVKCNFLEEGRWD